jgi:hypothetical protein
VAVGDPAGFPLGLEIGSGAAESHPASSTAETGTPVSKARDQLDPILLRLADLALGSLRTRENIHGTALRR